MTPYQIQRVQSTFKLLVPNATDVAALFYERLFELDPALRPLFKGDLKQQYGLLMTMLNTAVNSLDNVDALRPRLAALGARHAGYGVQASHYGTVAAALLDTLAKGLGARFDPTTREAWIAAYTVLAGAMQARVAVAEAA